jgi:15-cis-phytoene synthase
VARAVEAYAPRAMARTFAPPGYRPLYEAGDALEAEFEALAAPGLDHGVAHLKLGWWREECARLGAGAPRHPLTRALAESGAAGAAAQAFLSAALDAAARRLAGYVPADEEELLAELARASGLGVRLATLREVAPVRRHGESLAVAVALIELVTDVRGAARAGDLRLPLAPLREAGIEPAALAAAALPAPVEALLRALLARALGLIDNARAELPPGPTARAALASAEVEAALAARRARALLASPEMEAPHAGRLEVWRDLCAALAVRWRTRR